jgi:hypothetical protein
MSQFYTALLALALGTTSFFSSSVCSADVIYYHFETGITSVYYVDGDMVVRQTCTGLKVLEVRADCASGPIQKVFKLADANQNIADNFSHLLKSARDLDPIKSPTVHVLMGGAPFAQPELEAERQAAVADQANFQKIIDKFGTDSGIQSQLDAANIRLRNVQEKLSSNTTYTSALNELAPLTKTYFEMIADSTKIVQLVAAKTKDSLAGAISEELMHLSWGRPIITTPVVGQTVKIKTGAFSYGATSTAPDYYEKPGTILDFGMPWIKVHVPGEPVDAWWSLTDLEFDGTSWQD